MPSTSLVSALASRRLRAARPGMHGGASSLLRLARSGEPRLPSGAALSDWADRAAAMLDLTPMMVGPQALVTRPVPPAAQELSLQQAPRGVRA